jgi:glycosyltransferase involved in cell wall biosynthesis
MSRVCFFGAYDPDYPRFRILRQGLMSAGIEVIEARVELHRAFRRYPALLAAFVRTARHADVLLVPEFRHKDVPIARWLKGRRRLIFDPLVSRYDTLVHDWRLHREGSLQARWNRGIDRWALGLADIVLCDTWAHGELFESLGVARQRLRRVLVGAERDFFAIDEPREASPVRVIYIGGFLPLHGVATVLEAAARLEHERSLPEFRITLVGDGIDYRRSRADAVERGLTRLDFLGRRAYADAPELLAQAHVVLGAFGTNEKAGRVIPHKVYQGLAAGRAVITGDGAGVREVFEPESHLVLVPRGDAEALATALARLIARPAERARLGRCGRARALEIATPERIGASLAAVIAGGGEVPA